RRRNSSQFPVFGDPAARQETQEGLDRKTGRQPGALQLGLESTRLARRVADALDAGQPGVGGACRTSVLGAAWRVVGAHLLADRGSQQGDGRGEVFPLERARELADGDTTVGGLLTQVLGIRVSYCR